MRRLLCVLLMMAFALPVTAVGEERAFSASVLAQREDVTAYIDENGLTRVYRFSDQPFACEISQGLEAVAFVDFVELMLQGCTLPRLTLALISRQPIEARLVEITSGGEVWRFPIMPQASEYDATYYEDYGVILSQEGIPLLQGMGKGRGEYPFALYADEEAETPLVTGTLLLPKEQASQLYQLFVELGGLEQPMEQANASYPATRRKQ